MIVIGIDPGFANLGLAAVDITPGSERIVELRVVRTEKSGRKLDVKASDDNVRRAQEIAVQLEAFVLRHHPVAFAAESQSWPRDAGASAKVGIAWGVVAAVAAAHRIPLVQTSPQALKKALCGVKTASKEEVQAAIEQRFPAVIWPSPAGIVEHAADAAGAVLACMDSSAIQMARRLSEAQVA